MAIMTASAGDKLSEEIAASVFGAATGTGAFAGGSGFNLSAGNPSKQRKR
jgi:hypothetical protein